MIIFSNKVSGLVLNLELHKISAVVLGKDSAILPGDIVSRSFRLINIGVGDSILGKVVDPLGKVLSSFALSNISYEKFRDTLEMWYTCHSMDRRKHFIKSIAVKNFLGMSKREKYLTCLRFSTLIKH